MSHIYSTDDRGPATPPRAWTATGHGSPANAPTHGLIHVPHLLMPHDRLERVL
jgi:hypothetical protein